MRPLTHERLSLFRAAHRVYLWDIFLEEVCVRKNTFTVRIYPSCHIVSCAASIHQHINAICGCLFPGKEVRRAEERHREKREEGGRVIAHVVNICANISLSLSHFYFSVGPLLQHATTKVTF